MIKYLWKVGEKFFFDLLHFIKRWYNMGVFNDLKEKLNSLFSESKDKYKNFRQMVNIQIRGNSNTL